MPPGHPQTLTSAPRPGTAGGAAPRCTGLAGAYLRLVEALRASAADRDTAEENRLHNRAQLVLGRMVALRCPVSDPAELAP
jgi:hypothetical protein